MEEKGTIQKEGTVEEETKDRGTIEGEETKKGVATEEGGTIEEGGSVEGAEESDDLTLLESLDRVVIREQSGGCKNCKYVVLSAEGRELLYAAEDAGLVGQLLAGQSRALHVDLLDTRQNVVVKLRRPYAVGGGKLEVSVRGAPAAMVRREPTLLKPVLSVADARGRPLLRLKGPVSISSNCDFQLFSPDKQRAGVLRRRAGGGAHWAVLFPPRADLPTKAAVIGAALLIDFLFYL